MSRTYSYFVLICVVTQALTDLPEGLCQREIRKYQQVTKISSRRCTTRSRHCSTIQWIYCSYRIKNYNCTYLQYLQVEKVKLTYTCCDGYYSRNGRCEKEAVNVLSGTTCNTCLCNGTCTHDTGNVTSNTPVPTEGNKYEETVNATFESTCSTCLCNDTCETDANSVIGSIPVPTKAKHTQGGLKLILIIAIVILVVLTLIVQAALWIQQYKSETISERYTELQPSRNTSRDRNEALEEDDAHIYEL